MPSVDESVQKLIEECPILLDEDFLREHPAISGVAAFINETAKTTIRIKGRYELFDRLGVKNIRGYLELIRQGNPDAIKNYERLKDILCL